MQINKNDVNRNSGREHLNSSKSRSMQRAVNAASFVETSSAVDVPTGVVSRNQNGRNNTTEKHVTTNKKIKARQVAPINTNKDERIVSAFTVMQKHKEPS